MSHADQMIGYFVLMTLITGAMIGREQTVWNNVLVLFFLPDISSRYFEFKCHEIDIFNI